MSAIVAAMVAFSNYLPDRCALCWYPQSLHIDRSHKASEHRFVQDLAPRFIESTLIAAGRAINAASNAAGAGRVVEGAPRTWAVRWVCGPVMGWRPIIAVECLIFLPSVGFAADPDLRPTWLGDAWVWSTATHDPRPCAWPRPFARGADR